MRLRSYSKSISPKTSPSSLSSNSSSIHNSPNINRPKILYKPRNSSRPITETILYKYRNKIRKRKEMRYINTTPLPVNDLSQSVQLSQEEENGKDKEEEKDKDKEEEDDDFEDDEIEKNNKKNLTSPTISPLPESPTTEPDSPIHTTSLPTEIIPPPLPQIIINNKRLSNGINIIKPKPKRVKTDLISLDKVIVNKKYNDGNNNNTSSTTPEKGEDRIISSLSDIFGLN